MTKSTSNMPLPAYWSWNFYLYKFAVCEPERVFLSRARPCLGIVGRFFDPCFRQYSTKLSNM